MGLDVDPRSRTGRRSVAGQRPRKSRNPAAATTVRTSLAHNYDPLPVSIVEGEGCWVVDAGGRRLLDCLAAYSALNFGHRHPRLVEAAHRQLDRLTLTSRAFGNDVLGRFCDALAGLSGKETVLPMNTGAEAVETALKLARKWGRDVKGVAPERSRVVVLAGNFHGRTTTIVSFSTDRVARDGFCGPRSGFDVVPFGDADALEAAVTEETVAVLLEPVQGEAGVRIPPAGYLKRVRDACTRRGVLMVADEIQSGLGRTGSTFACDLEGVVPDVYVLGKALGGGILPLSAVVADAHLMAVFTPGSHGSTFGGNPLACAVGLEVVRMLESGEYQERARVLGPRLLDGLRAVTGSRPADVRGLGLWAAVELEADDIGAREACEGLLAEGVLAKDAHGSVVRLAPPLVIEPHEVDWATERVGRVLGPGRRSAVA